MMRRAQKLFRILYGYMMYCICCFILFAIINAILLRNQGVIVTMRPNATMLFFVGNTIFGGASISKGDNLTDIYGLESMPTNTTRLLYTMSSSEFRYKEISDDRDLFRMDQMSLMKTSTITLGDDTPKGVYLRGAGCGGDFTYIPGGIRIDNDCDSFVLSAIAPISANFTVLFDRSIYSTVGLEKGCVASDGCNILHDYIMVVWHAKKPISSENSVFISQIVDKHKSMVEYAIYMTFYLLPIVSFPFLMAC